MNGLDRFSRAGIVPVVVIDKAQDAVPTARALLAGGIDVMEITFRTEAAADAICEVVSACPEMFVGAGTVVTVEQCEKAVALGAKFIVSPGFDKDIVAWCVEHNVLVVPGCVTPSEIMEAMKMGLKVVKFFPANVYGGLNGMKALSAPFAGIKFVPTGGVNAQNLAEYLSAPFIHAVGGSWICSKQDISEGSFEKITALCKEARWLALGFEVAHVGINCKNAETSLNVCKEFEQMFGFATKNGNSSNFSSSAIEVMKTCYLGEKGHLAIKTNKIEMAIEVLKENGYEVDMETARYKGNKMNAVYLKNEIGGFALHLLQK